jgi:hypothetical protein
MRGREIKVMMRMMTAELVWPRYGFHVTAIDILLVTICACEIHLLAISVEYTFSGKMQFVIEEHTAVVDPFAGRLIGYRNFPRTVLFVEFISA